MNYNHLLAERRRINFAGSTFILRVAFMASFTALRSKDPWIIPMNSIRLIHFIPNHFHLAHFFFIATERGGEGVDPRQDRAQAPGWLRVSAFHPLKWCKSARNCANGRVELIIQMSGTQESTHLIWTQLIRLSLGWHLSVCLFVYILRPIHHSNDENRKNERIHSGSDQMEGRGEEEAECQTSSVNRLKCYFWYCSRWIESKKCRGKTIRRPKKKN